MTFDTPSQMQVVRKQEKEPKLKEFIGQELSRLEPAQTTGCLVMARTVDSPVMRAIAAFAGELEARGIRVRTVLASLDVDQPAEGVHSDWIASCETRWMRNQKLVDAHELLVIGEQAAWVGDCMRRDPQKRDAFELYSPGSATVTHRARVSFERIWALSEPVHSAHKWKPAPAASAADELAPAAPAAAAVAEATAPPMPGATRH